MVNIYASVILCIMLSYLIGTFNLSYFLSKMRGLDIREHGSGNAGASNTIIVLGKKKGMFVMALDIFKAYFAVKLSVYLFPKLLLAGVISAASVILGHIFPFYMGFRGGKGFASLGGSILALDYRIFFVLLIVTVCIVFISDYVCLGPTIISTVFAVGFGYIRNSLAVTLILLVPSICIWIRHMENFKRMKNGQELRFSFLWNRKSEAERLGIKDDDGESYHFSYDEGKFGE